MYLRRGGNRTSRRQPSIAARRLDRTSLLLEPLEPQRLRPVEEHELGPGPPRHVRDVPGPLHVDDILQELDRGSLQTTWWPQRNGSYTIARQDQDAGCGHGH